jgi:hypothetical membrane protein
MKISDKTLAGLFISIAVAQFILLLVLSEILYPNYNASTNFISDLGVGPTAYIFNSAAVILGLGVICASFLLRKATKDNIFFALIFITGICTMIVGIFPETTGAPHLIAAAGTFVLGGISAIISFRITKKSPLSYMSIVLGLITVVTFFASQISGSTFGLGQGGIERIIAYPVLIWLLMFGGYLLNDKR